MNKPAYKPGLHVLCTWKAPSEHLQDIERCRDFYQKLSKQFELQVLGEVYHAFDGENAGFTVCICLSESHLALHTWPEHGHLTFDLFLSNFQRDNRAKVKEMVEASRLFFEAEVVVEHQLER